MIRLNENDTLLFIGDSITHGGRLPSMDLNHIMGHGFAEMVASRLGAENLERMPRFINKGISGETSVAIAARWEADALAYAPTVINLLAGANDVNRSTELPVCEVLRSYTGAIENMLEKTRRALPNSLIFLCEPFYLDVQNQSEPYANIPHAKSEEDFAFSNATRIESRILAIKERLLAMQAALPGLAEKYGAVFVPLQDVFDAAAAKASPSYLIWDNIHPTMVGHRLIADRWLEIATPAFAARNG